LKNKLCFGGGHNKIGGAQKIGGTSPNAPSGLV